MPFLTIDLLEGCFPNANSKRELQEKVAAATVKALSATPASVR